jgi:Leucine-rich repeat (LRR) protein
MVKNDIFIPQIQINSKYHGLQTGYIVEKNTVTGLFLHLPLKIIPESISEFTQLKHLDIEYHTPSIEDEWDNEITFPLKLMKLTNLQQINLKDRKIENLWDVLLLDKAEIVQFNNPIPFHDMSKDDLLNGWKRLTSFIRVNDDMEFQEISEKEKRAAIDLFQKYENSVYFFVQNCTISRLELKISGSNSFEIPNSILFLTNLQFLQVFSDGSTEVKFPDSCDKFRNLSLISLIGCKLQEIPPWVIKNTALEELCLVNNEISKITENIVKLTNLTTLDLNFNRIRCLNYNIWQLQNLEILNLDFNRLHSLPPILQKHGNIDVRINLMHNPWSEFFMENVLSYSSIFNQNNFYRERAYYLDSTIGESRRSERRYQTRRHRETYYEGDERPMIKINFHVLRDLKQYFIPYIINKIENNIDLDVYDFEFPYYGIIESILEPKCKKLSTPVAKRILEILRNRNIIGKSDLTIHL